MIKDLPPKLTKYTWNFEKINNRKTNQLNVGKDLKRHKRRHTDGMLTYEKIFNIICHYVITD